ncbi:MAG TPA: antibiotic biosynthesis monooxygenase family protein [Polyangia bacterium]|nr:antibiotic biosynthesis monooxygenase family protein [Polyangia bacterium]
MKRIAIVVLMGILASTALARSKETNMVVEYIRYEVPAARHDEFLAAYNSAAKELASSSHCVSYEISEGVEEPDNFTVRIEWDSLDGHEKGFRGSAQFASFFTKVKPFFSEIREMKHYRVTVHGRGAAAK